MSEETTIPVAKTVWYKSVTLWTNVVTVGCLIATQYFGVAIDPKLQAGILAIVNLVLQAPTMAATKARAETHNRAVRARMVR
jgi:hypothetical protein